MGSTLELVAGELDCACRIIKKGSRTRLSDKVGPLPPHATFEDVINFSSFGGLQEKACSTQMDGGWAGLSDKTSGWD